MIEKIDTSNAEFKNRLHKYQSDVPKKTAAETKDFFDSMAKDVLVPKINELVEATNKKAEQNDVYTIEQTHEQFDPRNSCLVKIDDIEIQSDYVVGFCCLEDSIDECEFIVGVNINGDNIEARDVEIAITIYRGTITVESTDFSQNFSVGEMISLRRMFNCYDKADRFYINYWSEDTNTGYAGVYAISFGQFELSDLHEYTYPKSKVYTKAQIDAFNVGICDKFYYKADVYTKAETDALHNNIRAEFYPKANVYTKDEVMTLHNNMREEYYKKGEVYTKTQINIFNDEIKGLFHPKNDVYTKEETYAKSEVYSKEEVDDLHGKISDSLLVGYSINTPLVFMTSTKSLRDSERFIQYVDYTLFKALNPSGEEVNVYLRLGNQFSIFGGKSQIVLADDDNAPFFINGFEGYEITEITPLGEELIRCISPYMDLYIKYYIEQQTNVTGE